MKGLALIIVSLFSMFAYSKSFLPPIGEHAVLSCLNSDGSLEVQVLHDSFCPSWTGMALISNGVREQVDVTSVTRSADGLESYTAELGSGTLTLSLRSFESAPQKNSTISIQTEGNTTRTEVSCSTVMY